MGIVWPLRNGPEGDMAAACVSALGCLHPYPVWRPGGERARPVHLGRGPWAGSETRLRGWLPEARAQLQSLTSDTVAQSSKLN